MQSVKIQLLESLAVCLEQIAPGSASKAAFESPKMAAHGDYAITAAMQLAKPLKQNPRQLGEQLRAALLQQPSFTQWVQDVDIAGPGFINIRLKPSARARFWSWLRTTCIRWITGISWRPTGKAARR